MRKLATAWPGWIALAALFLIAHGAWMLRSGVGADLARCGAWWVVIAAAIIARPIIRRGYPKWYEDSRGVSGGSYDHTAEEIEEAKKASRMLSASKSSARSWQLKALFSGPMAISSAIS